MARSVTALSLLFINIAYAEILTPPYFNLAQGKKITATATCGDEGPELYCKLAGANTDGDEHVIQGQICDVCDSTSDSKNHPPEYAVDGMETWWQSPPLSRGMKYNEINLTIDLGQEFHVAYVFVRMGISPRPGLWALEKSTDYGKTYKPWQYFSDSQYDCQLYFGEESLKPITRDDSVICSTEYSRIVPLEGGEIPISLLNYRPSANKYFNSSVLQEWTRATNVRLRLLRTKNMLGHLMSVARQDPTVTRRYFYSIKDISIGGRCMCNGHADTCDPADPASESNILVCRCQHNTCGPQCAECCPGFEQKKWRISQNWDRFECEPCNCHNHSTECKYDPEVDEKHLSLDIHNKLEGGGVCQNCQHNTEGINCNKCRPTFYRPRGSTWDMIDVCQPCQCDLHYSTGNCAEETGQCECRKEFLPPNCDACAYGYFDYPDCKPCTCNLNGTEGNNCTPIGGLCPCKFNYAGDSCEICADSFYSPECKNCECNKIGSVSQVCNKETGQCECKGKFSGRTCNQCEAGYFNYPTCKHCNCDISGTEKSVCDDITGQCICKTGFGGARCDQCIAGYYMEVRGRDRLCVPCNCSPTGSTSTSCSADGKCNCLINFGGKQCDQCSPGYYKFPDCLACNCDLSGSLGSTCDDDGLCHCRPNFDGSKCDRCKPQFYNYPACEECNCDPRGVVASFAGCGSVPEGELCLCKERVQGRICNDCMPLFWNLQDYNPVGCEKCSCNVSGTLGGLGVCETRSGQCTCKMHVGERQCDQCQNGFYQLESNNVFGCTECDCDVGGSIDNNCDKLTGQCHCHSRVEGRRCDRPIQAHYFPTLHQFQYEVEEGLTQSGPVRYRNNERVFPGYSWKGYVVFTLLQNEVINIVHILSKSSLYRMVVKYANPLRDPVIATIIITPESVVDITQQQFSVLLKPTTEPQLVTVSGEKGLAPAPFIMNPGNWTVTIKTTKEVMIDYFVLVPEAYYEATVLTKLVEKPCIIEDRELCRHYVYPSIAGRPKADINTLTTSVTAFIEGEQQLKELNVDPNTIPLLNNDQDELQYDIKIDPPGRYHILIEYVTPVSPGSTPEGREMFSPRNTATIRFQSGDGPESYAIVNLNNCPYTSPCRQVVVNDLSMISAFNVIAANNVIYLNGERNTLAGIKSIIAIPESEWNLDYITPRPYCLRRNGRCEPAVFSAAVDSKKVEIESGSGGDAVTRPPILDNSTTVVYLSSSTEPVVVETKVPGPSDYMFVVHYYQPDHPRSNIDVKLAIDGQLYEATLPVEHCPSNSGCRSLIQLGDDRKQFPVNENINITFLGDKSKGVWLDYILVVASPDFVDGALKEINMVDNTQQFIENCAANHYYISPNETGFCRDAMFSITSEYNSGALACMCDIMGSTELECNTFGGQCPCKPNVIGRACTTCRTGYYGFPNCRPCHCSDAAICDDNGMCICPKNVQGDKCDSCKPLTFNFDMQRGCDDCNCNRLGVIGNRLQCHNETGNCDCKENVIGRVCDHCVPGHYAFPDCLPCTCDRDGTTDDVCDQNTAQCYCKKHVYGQACDTCREDYFNLQDENPDGCTKCYCFGKTTRCSSSSLYWAEINGMSDWYLSNIDSNRTINIYPLSLDPAPINDTAIQANLLGTGDDSPKVLYFGAPQYYLGKRLTSYGGYLTYSVHYTARYGGRAAAAPDVIIGGSSGYLIHNSIEQPPALTTWSHSLKLSEDQFTNLDGSAVTRNQFMNTLVNVTSIYIRATYWHETVNTVLSTVSLEVAIPENEYSKRADSVEECQCPQAYRGLSCEQCAIGYYRLSSGPHAGLCVPCQCNGHSRECDVNTGICLECTDNTMGDHCEMCILGYHGNATVGTPLDCLICACPIPYASNNFAIGCELSENGSLISCECERGYAGARCDHCAAGFYGQPEVIGDNCKPCNCSGNIIEDDVGSCDSITGDCLKCVNNTAGAACNLCAPGFYGDAIFSKNCTACICDLLGMDHCDPSTGTCICRPGVIGEKCDLCAPDHWGLDSGYGCTPCDCGLASLSSQCDDSTGQCRCAKGVTGRHCDQCAAGYWNYTKEGCDHCNCNTGYSHGFTCNATGQCECLPGVIGEKCDRCPERWVLIPHKRCQQCDSCTDALIFSVEDMTDLLANETQEFKDKADSFFTTQRLNYISNQTNSLRPRVAELRNVDLDNVTNKLKTVEDTAGKLLRSAEYTAGDSDALVGKAADLAAEADKVLSIARESGDSAKEVVTHVVNLAKGLEVSQQLKVDTALAEAREMKNYIAEIDLIPKTQSANNVFANATNQNERINVFVQPVYEQAKKFDALVNATHDFKNKLDNLLEYTDIAQHTADIADKLNIKNKHSKFGENVQKVTNLHEAVMKNLIIYAAQYTNNATTYNGKARDTIADSEAALKELSEQIQLAEDTLSKLEVELPKLRDLNDAVNSHTANLSNQADNLRVLAERENNNSRTQDAYRAASAFSSIVQEIGDAKKAADEAEGVDRRTTDIKNLLINRVDPARDRSQILLDEAQNAMDIVNNNLGPNLTLAETLLENAAKTLQNADDINGAIELDRSALPTLGASALEDEATKAEKVNATVKNTLEIMSEIGRSLSASKDWSRTVPKQANEAQARIANIKQLLANVTDLYDKIISKEDTVQTLQNIHNPLRQTADHKLEELKKLIEQARTVANRIQVGVSFDSQSTLQPRLPDNLDEISTSTNVSAYFRTKRKDGFLLYLGNPKGTNLRKTKSDDFMVLSIRNGYPYLTMDIGDSANGREPVKITSDKFVADNKWYQVIVDRVGRQVKFSIRETLDNGTEFTHSKEATLPGVHTIFNLDRQKSQLYVGGVPPGKSLQGVDVRDFEGQIEELMVGNTPVGLWNFIGASDLKGARQRDKLLKTATGPQEYRFTGFSHVIISGGGYLVRQKNHIQLFFKTYASDGLIYFVGDNNDYFFSVQMKNGNVNLLVALGPREEDIVSIHTSKAYNDGKWHKLDAARYLSNCSLKVDGDTLRTVSLSSNTDIPAVNMNFGGLRYKNIERVTDKGFDGCIRQISIDRINVELSDSIESIGVAYKCQFSSLVSLSGESSYLRYNDISSQNAHITLKFKTSEPDGLLFVYVSRTQTNNDDSMSLSIINGQLVLSSKRERLDSGLNVYNDSQWHVVTVTHGEKALTMSIDDYDFFSTDTAPDSLSILNGVLFIGGVQPGYIISAKVGSKKPFRGCIADAAIKGLVLNLLSPYNNSSITFGRCGDITYLGGVPGDASWATPAPPEAVLPIPRPPPEPEAVPEQTEIPVTTVQNLPHLRSGVFEPAHTIGLETTSQPLTTLAPTTPRPRPRPEPGCSLAYDPYYTTGTPAEGYRFGTRNDSRIEYATLPGRQLDVFDLTISFRTFDSHGGLMFYAAADFMPEQFLAVYMKDAKVHLSFNCGERTATVASTQLYNDTEWHTATIVRNGGNGKLTIDGEHIGDASVPCFDPAVLSAPYYYGGLRNITTYYNDSVGFYQTFMGCLKGLMMNGQYVTDILYRVNSLRCIDHVEDGIYFGPTNDGHSSYLKLYSRYNVGNEIAVSMDVKPRNTTGLLFSVHGRRDYMIIELLENEVVAKVDNGKGPFQATFKLGNKFSLCDGKWHKIHVVKSRHVVSVGVDGHFSDAGIGQSPSTDTRSGLYIGGHEKPIHRVMGARARRGFVGCIKNIKIKEQNVPISLTGAGRNTHIGVCPND
ncbi:laminin subunit alpha [Achroia grisella]|uniref:laminin subunit alpha n=1 Tax=Achroia grisella TaxID=688607 RepID=UPI0027D28EA6|nr:laminin subunit alpha [Achroia grisella]